MQRREEIELATPGNGDLAFTRMMETLAQQLLIMNIDLHREQLTIVDVGSGSMRYGHTLERWALTLAEYVRILAVDPQYRLPPSEYSFFPKAFCGNSRIERIPAFIETALPLLRANNVRKIDLITLFNPNPGQTPLPNVTRLEELCREVPLVGACDSVIQKPVIVQELSEQGYSVATLRNPARDGMRTGYAYEFDLVFVALPKKSSSSVQL